MKGYWFSWLILLAALGGIVALSGCATTSAEGDGTVSPLAAAAGAGGAPGGEQPFPAYSGPKTVVAVLPLGLSERSAKKYPHLLAKDVGLGIHNRVIETLFDTNRFRFVEEKQEVIKDIMDRQWMSSAGMVDQGTAVQLGKMLGAQKVIYGEVYDFAEGGDRIVGLSAQKGLRTRMGVQVRCVDVETLEYVPGSGVGVGADVGEAAGRAINEAVHALVRRLH